MLTTLNLVTSPAKDASNQMKRAAVAIVLLLSAWAVAASGESYTYVSYSAPNDYSDGVNAVVFDFAKGRIEGKDSHGRQRLKRCDTEALHCFTSGSVKFAVPRGRLRVAESWTHESQTFRVDRTMHLKVMGRDYEVFVIESDRSGTRTDRFFYSMKLGLVAIKYEETDTKNPYVDFLVLEERRGFPR
jgi:hypothetical protein